MDRQALAGVFIDYHHQLDRPTIIRTVEHEIPRPDMIGSLWT
jgi:hypothetical protein